MTFLAYEKVYESACTYGIRKVIESQEKYEQEKELEYKRSNEIQELKKSAANLKTQLDNLEENFRVEREEMIKTREKELSDEREEIDRLKVIA